MRIYIKDSEIANNVVGMRLDADCQLTAERLHIHGNQVGVMIKSDFCSRVESCVSQYLKDGEERHKVLEHIRNSRLIDTKKSGEGWYATLTTMLANHATILTAIAPIVSGWLADLKN